MRSLGSPRRSRGGRGTRTMRPGMAPAGCWGPSVGPEAERADARKHLHLRLFIQRR